MHGGRIIGYLLLASSPYPFLGVLGLHLQLSANHPRLLSPNPFQASRPVMNTLQSLQTFNPMTEKLTFSWKSSRNSQRIIQRRASGYHRRYLTQGTSEVLLPNLCLRWKVLRVQNRLRIFSPSSRRHFIFPLPSLLYSS